MIRLQCNKHPKYKAKRVPQCDCNTCWAIWQLIDRLVYHQQIRVFSKEPK